MTPGMVFTIEPILVEGNRRISVWEDGWTAATLDGGRYANSLQLWNLLQNDAKQLKLPVYRYLHMF